MDIKHNFLNLKPCLGDLNVLPTFPVPVCVYLGIFITPEFNQMFKTNSKPLFEQGLEGQSTTHILSRLGFSSNVCKTRNSMVVLCI